MINVAINGFGRIGRSFLRALIAKNSDIRIVAINDLGSLTQLAQLLKYDTTFGRFPAEINIREDLLIVDRHEIRIYQERNPANLPWKALNIDVVVESTGVFTDGKKAQAHLTSGAKKVLISAPGTDVDLTLVLGVNHNQYQINKHHIISNASCTTNCLAAIAKVLQDNFGIESGFMTTVHAYTQDQNLQDAPHSDMCRARSAVKNIVPTSTGAAESIGQVIPILQGKLDGASIRVPVITGSMIDLTVNLQRAVSVAEVNSLFKQAAQSSDLRNILTWTDDPIVSSDIIQNSASAIFDAGLTKIINEKLLKVVSWYDNEWGFANHLIDAIIYIA